MTKPKYLNINYIDTAESIEYNGKECNTTDNIFPLGRITSDDIYDFIVEFTVDIDTGEILNWPTGNVANIYSKPVDSGIYTFKNAEKENIFVYSGYVLDGLDIEDNGYGDYIILSIDEKGIIKNWDKKRILNTYKHIKNNPEKYDVVE